MKGTYCIFSIGYFRVETVLRNMQFTILAKANIQINYFLFNFSSFGKSLEIENTIFLYLPDGEVLGQPVPRGEENEQHGDEHEVEEEVEEVSDLERVELQLKERREDWVLEQVVEGVHVGEVLQPLGVHLAGALPALDEELALLPFLLGLRGFKKK